MKNPGLESSWLKSLGLKSPGLESSWLKNPGLESSWLKSLGLKGLGLKLGVEKSGVEMSFNPSETAPRNLIFSMAMDADYSS